MSADQNDIDNLLDDIGGQNPAEESSSSESVEAEINDTAPSENTGEMQKDKEEEDLSGTFQNKGIPWVDYIPDPPPPVPEDPIEALKEYYCDRDSDFRERERNLVTCIDEGFHEAFYTMCIRQSSDYFRVLARLRLRKRLGKKRLKAFRDIDDDGNTISNLDDILPESAKRLERAKKKFEESGSIVQESAPSAEPTASDDPFEAASAAAANEESQADPFEAAMAEASGDSEQPAETPSEELDPFEAAMAEASGDSEE